MFQFFASIFGYVLNFMNNFVGNYGLAIILFTVLIKIIMLPLSIKQQRTMKKSAKLQEQIKVLQFKYKNDPEKLNREMMDLYKKENMSPFSGCLSTIVQFILLISIFYMVRFPLTYMKKVDANVINKYTKIIKENDLSTDSAYPEIEVIRELDNIKKLKENNTENIEKNSENNEEKTDLAEINDEELNSLDINMNFLGLNLAQIPTRSGDWKAFIIPVLYVLVSVISLRITNPTPKKKDGEEKNSEDEFDPMAQMNKNMNLMFPVMYLAVALIAPLGLALYWLMNSLLMIIERLALNKMLKDEEE